MHFVLDCDVPMRGRFDGVSLVFLHLSRSQIGETGSKDAFTFFRISILGWEVRSDNELARRPTSRYLFHFLSTKYLTCMDLLWVHLLYRAQ